jgi:glycerophosphoryl diester phosphodiesterase
LNHPYLSAVKGFKVLAHRGFAPAGSDRLENTLAAFEAALAAGADYLELDVQSTSDGVAVVFHDASLDRLSSTKGKLRDFTFKELKNVKLRNGASIPSVRDLFRAFPNARFNIDIKDEGAIAELANAISEFDCASRVLLTSFSESRRRKVLRLAPGTATSPSARLMVEILLAVRFRLGVKRLLKSVNVLQIPVSYGPLRLDSPRFIEAIHRHGVEVHYWTINDPSEARRLMESGADGVVSDNTAQLIAKLAE